MDQGLEEVQESGGGVVQEVGGAGVQEVGGGGVLRLERVDRKDSGEYTCRKRIFKSLRAFPTIIC